MPWGILLLVLAVACPAVRAQSYCDPTCQAAQQQSLASLYNATGGPTWAKTLVVVWDPAGWLNTTQKDARPAHCLWSGRALLCRSRGSPSVLIRSLQVAQASHPLTGAGRRLLLRPVGTADRPSPASHRPHSAGPVPKHKACGVHSAPGCHCAASAPPESDGPARWGRLHIPGAQPDQAGCWRYAFSCAA